MHTGMYIACVYLHKRHSLVSIEVMTDRHHSSLAQSLSILHGKQRPEHSRRSEPYVQEQ